MLGKMSLARPHIAQDAFQMTDIVFRIERIDRLI